MIERIPVTDRTDWLALRRSVVSASEVAAVFGVSPFLTPLDLYVAKVNGTEIDETALLQRGRWLEAAATAALDEERPGWKARPLGLFLRDVDRRLGATPDLVNVLGEPVEVKAPTPRTFDLEWEDGPPLHYQLQALQQAMLLDAGRAWIAALVVDGWRADLHTFEVMRVAEAEDRIVTGVAEFWRRIEERDPPRAEYGYDSASLAALYPREVAGKTVDLTMDNLLPELLDEREDLKAQEKAAKGRIDEIDDEIKAKLGDAERALVADGRTITWKTQQRREVVLPAASFRVLRVGKREAARVSCG